jgi:hemoglobin
MNKTIYELLEGETVIRELAEAFYRRVLADPVLLPLFHNPDEDHSGRMALWLTEQFGGPAEHSRQRGGFDKVQRVHLHLKISDEERAAWLKHMLAACEELKLSREFMDFFVPKIEFETKMAQKESWS